MAFVWLKKNRRADSWFYGLGFWTRGNAEICLLATRGHPKRQAADIHQFIISPREQHSKKPDVVREKIVALMGDIPHKGNDLFPDNIRFFAVLLSRRDDELVNICGLPFGMAPSGQQTYFGVPSCPEPQPIEPAIRPAVFLQPDKRHCFIAEPP